MKVRILKKRPDFLEFVLEDTNPAFANTLRRIMLSEVPTMAVQWADIHENNSALFDEIISHRLGMIPIRFDPKNYSTPGECECNGKGCPACKAVFVIDRKGPGIVHSGDMVSNDRKVAPIDPNIPIVELLDGQSLKLEAIAKLDTGLRHAKHFAANASYQYYPKIRFSGSPSDAKKAAKACPKDTLVAKDGKLQLKDPAKCDLCRECLESVKGVKLEGDETRIIFRVESISGLEPEYIVGKAAEIMAAKAEEFKKKLEKI